MASDVLRIASLVILTSAFARAAEPAPLRDTLTRILARPVLDRAEVDTKLADAILKRIPASDFPADRAEWEARAQELRERVLKEVIFAGVPREIAGGAPRVEQGAVIERKGYRIQKLRYEAYPGLWIPALFYQPDPLPPPGEKLACVLNPNGHVGPLGKARPEEQIRCVNLARRGIPALKLEWFAFGELAAGSFDHNSIAHLDLCGTSGVSLFYLALKRGLDVMLGHPAADPDRVAVTGLSGGGWQTIVIAALDPRVKAMIPNAGYSGLALRVEHAGSIGDLEQNPTDLVAIADYPLLTAAFAPRPALLIYNQKDDCCFPAAGARASVYDPVAPLYKRFYPGVEFAFHENTDPGTHNYDIDNRQALYRFLNRQHYARGPAIDEEIPCEEEVLDAKELTVGLPPGNLDFHRIAVDLARDLPRESWPRPASLGTLLAWRAPSIAKLREILRVAPTRVASVREVWRESQPDLEARGQVLELEDGSLLGVVELFRLSPASEAAALPGPEPRAAVAFADNGRADLLSEVEDLLSKGFRVFLVEPALSGENRPTRMGTAQWAMMFAATGARPLGFQISQLLAAAAWARSESGGAPTMVLGSGTTASVAALLCGALDRDLSPVAAIGLPPGLKSLIDDGVDYGRAPGLFAFGLLASFDVKELIALASPRRVILVRPAGDPARRAAAIGSLNEALAAIGAPAIETCAGLRESSLMR